MTADRVSAFSWMLSSAFAGLAGVLLAPLFAQLAAPNFTILLIAALSVLAPLIAPADPLKVDLAFFRKPPGSVHPLGTDSAGRDVLSRLLFAGQVSLTVGLVAAMMSTSIGLLLGSVAGTYGGWIDAVIMRLTDVVLSFPALVVITMMPS